MERVHRVTEAMNDEEQGDFGAGRVRVIQIFTLKQIGEKARTKKRIV